MGRFIDWLNKAILAIEVLVAIALVVLATGVFMSLGLQMFEVASGGLAISRTEFNLVISTVLEVFILVELFRIAIAYMRHENVIPTVLEAALVAVARKFVVLEDKTDFLQTAVGMSALLLAVAVSWWLLARSNACELSETE
jgi:uncharacterized membrane protein (DUF373 family)